MSTFLIAMVLCHFCFVGSELYVSSNGSDSNPGIQEKPLASLQKARDVIRKSRAEGKFPSNEVVTV